MKLSVIIPSYNFEKYIEECILSFSNQNTNFDFEIIVRDDGSTDNSPKIIEKLKTDVKNLRVLDGSENLGALKNIEILLRHARGKYITYLDGDDYLTNMDTLQKQVDFLESNPEYVLHCCGYKWLDNDGNLTPDEGIFCGLKEDITQEDLTENNYITFCRTFKNLPNLISNEYENFTYLDWFINFNILNYGKAKSEKWLAGIYRITNDGMITSQTTEEKNQTFNSVKQYLKEIYDKKKNDSVLIIDCFIHSKLIEDRLIDFLKKIKKLDKKIMLICNTHFSNEVLSLVDYVFFDKRNQLLEKEDYKNSFIIDFWKQTPELKAHDLIDVVQFHGMSVLINLRNSIEYAKILGFKNFERLEADCVIGNESAKFMKNVPKLLKEKGKSSLVYYNKEEFTEDIVFWYMYGNVDYFLNVIPKIDNEDEYRQSLKDVYGDIRYVLVEKLVYDRIKIVGENSILIKNKDEFFHDFNDSVFNQETSPANIPKKYKNATTRLYRIQYLENDEEKYQDDLLLISWNYGSTEKNRNIIIYYKDGTTKEVNQNIKKKGEKYDYQIDYIGFNVDKIDVFENSELLYTEINENLRNNIRYEK